MEKNKNKMRPSGRFYLVMFVFNMIAGLIGFLLMWAVRAITSNSLIGIVITGVVFLGFAIYVNFFVVKKSKIILPFFLYGTAINMFFVFIPTLLMMM